MKWVVILLICLIVYWTSLAYSFVPGIVGGLIAAVITLFVAQVKR